MGDVFVSDIYYELPAKNTANRSAGEKQLYLFENYIVKGYSTNPLAPTRQTVPARLLNALINGLNDNTYLPRLIIIALDWDIVQYVASAKLKVKYGHFAIYEILMKSVITGMNRAIDTRKDDLCKFSKGAIAQSEPKFLWTKMLDRVGVVNPTLAFRAKFNRALENILVDRRAHYIIDLFLPPTTRAKW